MRPPHITVNCSALLLAPLGLPLPQPSVHPLLSPRGFEPRPGVPPAAGFCFGERERPRRNGGVVNLIQNDPGAATPPHLPRIDSHLWLLGHYLRAMSPLKKIRPKKATAAKLRNWRAWLLRQRTQPLGTSDDSLSLILRRLEGNRTQARLHDGRATDPHCHRLFGTVLAKADTAFQARPLVNRLNLA